MEKIREIEKTSIQRGVNLRNKGYAAECETLNEVAGREVSGSFAAFNLEEKKPSLLLHSCCGPCSTSVLERLAPDYSITVFYFNPCITEQDEYEKRKANQIAFIEKFNQTASSGEGISFLEGEYLPEVYLEAVKGFEDQPEGGKRCNICFRLRLSETARKAKELEMDYFTTTLTVSPHKNYSLISSIAKEEAETIGVEFLDIDFKKKAGFQRSVQLAKEYGLYRQDYCGCRFSKRD